MSSPEQSSRSNNNRRRHHQRGGRGRGGNINNVPVANSSETGGNDFWDFSDISSPDTVGANVGTNAGTAVRPAQVTPVNLAKADFASGDGNVEVAPSAEPQEEKRRRNRRSNESKRKDDQEIAPVEKNGKGQNNNNNNRRGRKSANGTTAVQLPQQPVNDSSSPAAQASQLPDPSLEAEQQQQVSLTPQYNDDLGGDEVEEEEEFDIDGEVEMVCGMYTDEIRGPFYQESTSAKAKQHHKRATLLEVHLSGFQLEIRIPPFGYPFTRRPDVRVVEGPNVGYTTQLERTLKALIETELELGLPMVVLLINVMQDQVQLVVDEMEAEASAKVTAMEEAELERAKEEAAYFSSGIDIHQGSPISDRKSKFLAHVARVDSVQQAMNVVKELRSNKSIAMACHPTIWAYRIRDKSGKMHQDADDDGETAASKKLLFLLDQTDLENVVVVVTRWFGGILLGPDRFKHIFNCAKEALVTHKFLEK